MTKNIKIRILIATLLLIFGLTIWQISLNPAQKVSSNSQIDIVPLFSSKTKQYSPSEVRIKAGTKARITENINAIADRINTAVIKDYIINKKISQDKNIIKFMIDGPSNYEIRCANFKDKTKLSTK